MKFTELKNKMETLTNKSEILSDITILKNVGISTFSANIKTFSEVIFENENDYLRKDIFMQELMEKFTVVKVFTDIEFVEDDNYLDIYDFIMASGLFDEVTLGNDPITYSEAERFIKLFHDYIDNEIKEVNRMERIINVKLEKLINKIPDTKEWNKLLKSTMKEFKGLDKGAIDKIKDIFAIKNIDNPTPSGTN